MSYLPNDINDDVTVDPAHIQANDAALDNAISGNLTELNFSSATRVPNSMLASPNVEEIIELHWGQVAAGSIWPANSTTIPATMIRIPGSATYTILGASYAYTSVTGGGTTGSVSINAGSIAANVYSSATTLVAGVALPVLTSGQSASADFTLAATSFTAPTTLALLSTVSGATTLLRLTVTLRVTRSLQ